MHDDDLLAQQHRFVQLMGHQNDGAGHFLLDAQQLGLQLLPRQKVQRREGLVHQQQLRLPRQHSGKAQPLLHAGGQLHRGQVGIVLQPYQPDKIPRLFVALLRRLAYAAGHGHVALRVRPRDHIGLRTEHGAVPALRHRDLSRVRLLLPRQQLQQRAFSAAAAPHDHRQLSHRKGQ